VEGANLYNKEGLPATPFHVEDVTLQHTITALAGAGGTITPAGAASYLPRATVLYTITPAAGYFVQDVKVDGVSVGSVKYFTFDPLQKDRTIAATFAKAAPAYAVTVSANGGGRVTPDGSFRDRTRARQSGGVGRGWCCHRGTGSVHVCRCSRQPHAHGDLRLHGPRDGRLWRNDLAVG
jgi:hypothetical protein